MPRRQPPDFDPDFDPGVDGRQHEWFADYDAGRTAIIETYGVRVLRFTNAEVCDDLDSVLARIGAELCLPFD